MGRRISNTRTSPSPNPLAEVLKKHQHYFHPVVGFDPAREKIVAFDFSAANKELAGIDTGDSSAFNKYVSSLLDKQGAKFGVGGYDELRNVYQSSTLFDKNVGLADIGSSPEPRRLHLGTDIWGEEATEIFTPLEGKVHSLAFNDYHGDYGATIILNHQLEKISFYTLYGHLSLRDIALLREGCFFSKGQLLGNFGGFAENGNWPPHLHFQIIRDIGLYKGDYPGVCRYSERSRYLENCPNPDLLLGMNKRL